MNFHRTRFRISIALEGPGPDTMRLLAAYELPENGMRLRGAPEADGPRSELLPPGTEATFTCSRSTWLRIKTEAVKQGAEWSSGVSRRKEIFWSSKPKVTVFTLEHEPISAGANSRFSLQEGRVIGVIDGFVREIVVRDRRTNQVV